MKAKFLITAALLIFVAVSVVYLVAKKPSTEETSSCTKTACPMPSKKAPSGCPATQRVADAVSLRKPVAKTNPAVESTKVIAYYFHSSKRCRTCVKIEELTRKTIQNNFGEAIKKGDLEIRAVNTDLPENRHYIEDYKLFSKSVVLVDVSDKKKDRWRNLSRIWELIRDEEAYGKYLSDEIKEFMGAG